MKDAQLRAVTPEDKAFLYDLYSTTRTAELEALGNDPDLRKTFLDLQFQAQNRHYAAAFPQADHWVVMKNYRAMGRMLVWQSPNEIRLVDISLLPAFRGRGIGTGLIRGLQSKAREEEKPLRLQVLGINPAGRLYRRLGFKVVGERGLYLQMEWAVGISPRDTPDRHSS